MEDYSCLCGKTTGKFYEGKICDKCGTEVKYAGMAIDKCGWIDLSLSEYEDGVCMKKGNGVHLIEYIAYSQLEKIIGREHLKNIIHSRNILTISGDLDTTELDAIRIEKPENKYYFYGMENFYENYNEILDYYSELNKKTTTELYTFLKNREDVFTDKIPVISIVLRPAMRTSEGLKLDEINIRYQNILRNLEMLRDTNTIQIIRESTLEMLQAEYMLLNEDIMEKIKSKAGIIRNQICGTRVNFSARNIISPAKAGYSIDEIVLPYLTFLELYKFEIIGILKNTENISFKKAEDEWFAASLQMNEKVYKIMQKIIADNEVGILLNRNPTISYGSILYLRVAGVKHDYQDMTMSLNSLILSPLAGDQIL